MEDQDEGWTVVRKKKEMKLSITIADYSKPNRMQCHRAIHSYLRQRQNLYRYLLLQSCPNPMWLTIKRQSLIERILYIDIQVDCSPIFLQKILSDICPVEATAIFRPGTIVKERFWDKILSYDQKGNKLKSVKFQPNKLLTEELLSLYNKCVLSEVELKGNLYPDKRLPLYSDYMTIEEESNEQERDINNSILIVDCEMVTTSLGFELARATIINYAGELLHDQFYLPSNPVLDYNTLYSGITLETLSGVKRNIEKDLHHDLKRIIKKDTILVGHSLENDLRAMKLIHERVIDTSLLYARSNGAKYKLKALAEAVLQDCLATLHLLQAKVEHCPPSHELLIEMAQANKPVAIVDHSPEGLEQAAITLIPETLAPNDVLHIVLSKIHTHLLVMTRIVKNAIPKPIQPTKSQAFAPAILQNKELFNTPNKCYYQSFQQGFRQLYQQLPAKSAIFINCQPQQSSQERPYCFVIAK